MTSTHPSLAAAVGVSLALLAPIAARAQGADDYINADRPGLADGSEVVGPGRFQVEAGAQRESRRDGTASERTLFLPTLLRLGLSKDWELRVETSGAHVWDRTNDTSSGETKSEGAEPVSIGVKYHFQEGDGPKQPSLGAILRVFPASGAGAFRTAHTTADLRLAADWDFAPNWSLNPNVGVALNESDGEAYAAALFATTLSYSPSPVLNLFVDTGVQSPEEKDGRTSLIYDAGLAYIIGRDVQLDASLGTGGAGSTPPHPFVALGVSARF